MNRVEHGLPGEDVVWEMQFQFLVAVGIESIPLSMLSSVLQLTEQGISSLSAWMITHL